MGDKERLTPEAVAIRCAAEFADGWLVNLGIGRPTLCSNFVPEGRSVVFHAQNGVIGYGRLAFEHEVDIHLINAGLQHVTLLPGAVTLDSADAFAIARSGRLDAAVVGSYEVSEKGDLANYQLPNRKGGQLGGAMDVVSGAKRVFVVMDHTAADGSPRLLRQCTLPITARGVVTRVFTDIGVFDVNAEGFVLAEIAPGWTPGEVQEITEATLTVSPDLRDMDAGPR